jgi:dTMP kinase
MAKGRFVVLEGVDGCGKTTQQTMLVDRLRGQGVAAAQYSFPRKDGPVSSLIEGYLRGVDGPSEFFEPEVVSLLFALDRYMSRKEIISILNAGINLILSRYWYSNVVFQSVRLPYGLQQEDFTEWVISLDERMPVPDGVILLDIEPSEAYRRMLSSRGSVDMDRLEKDALLQKEAAWLYKQYARRWGWIIIDASRDAQSVHNDLWEYVSPLFVGV